jgi:predicted O-linked N-acetylglucosamine transferase (SPINDLY family)
MNNINNLIYLIQSSLFTKAYEVATQILSKEPSNIYVLYLFSIIQVNIGELELANTTLTNILDIDPYNFDSLYLKTRVLMDLNLHEEAIIFHERTISISKNNIWSLLNRGNSYAALKKFTLAIDDFNKVIDLNPLLPDVYLNKANSLRELNHYDDSIDNYRKAIKLRTNFTDAWNNLGQLLLLLKKYEEALICFNNVLKYDNFYINAYFNKSTALMLIFQFKEALLVVNNGLNIEPNHPELLYIKASILHQYQQHTEALDCINKVINFNNNHYDAWLMRGLILRELKLYEHSLDCFDTALKFNSLLHEAWLNRGLVLRDLNCQEEALASFDKAISLNPNSLIYRIYRIVESLIVVPNSTLESVTNTEQFFIQLLKFEQYIFSLDFNNKRLSSELSFIFPYFLAYRPGNHKSLLLKYNSIIKHLTNDLSNLQVTKRKSLDKIRLIIVSSYFRRHSVWDIILKGLIRYLDRSKFELFLYNTSNMSADDETTWAKANCDLWKDSFSFANNESFLNEFLNDSPDVIFYPELAMDSTSLFCASQRLAPLQLVSWGHPITSGFNSIDFFISGDLFEYSGSQAYYSEKLFSLPGTGCCTEPINIDPLNSRELIEINQLFSEFTSPKFIIPHNPSKFDPSDDFLFAEIARSVGSCSFIFFEYLSNKKLLNIVLERISNVFLEYGLDPCLYIRILPHQSRNNFLKILDLSDIYLDCPNFSGYTTAWQAAQQGLPIVTLEGEYLRQRLASGLLKLIGQTGTIASNHNEYIQIACKLAALQSNDSVSYSNLRSTLKLASNKSNHRIEVIRSFENFILDNISLN